MLQGGPVHCGNYLLRKSQTKFVYVCPYCCEEFGAVELQPKSKLALSREEICLDYPRCET